VAILAGGQATRLRPLTQHIPKALVEVAGRPFIDHQLALLRRHGARRVVICAGYLGEMIRDHVGDGRAFGLDVAYSFDGPSPAGVGRLLGTAGALVKALPQLGPAFFVLYGDSYLPCDYGAVQRAFLASGRPALMTVYRNEGQWDSSNVEMAESSGQWSGVGGQSLTTDHRAPTTGSPDAGGSEARAAQGVIRAYSKKEKSPRMRHIDYGLGLLTAAALDGTPAHEPSDLADVYQRLVVSGQLAALEIPERFYEIGSFQGLEELSRLLEEDASGRWSVVRL